MQHRVIMTHEYTHTPTRDINRNKQMNKTYKVEVIRTTHDSMSFDVEAKDENEANELALEIAMEALWGSGNAEYEVEYLKEIEVND